MSYLGSIKRQDNNAKKSKKARDRREKYKGTHDFTQKKPIRPRFESESEEITFFMDRWF